MLHIINCQTAHEMWKKARKASIFNLQQEYYNFAKASQDAMAVYTSKLLSIVKQLKDLGETISDTMVMTKILMTLPPNLSHFSSVWESSAADNKTIQNLIQRLITKEARQRSQENIDSSALAAKFIKNKQKSSGRKNGQCNNCGEQGYWVRDCPKSRSTSSHRSNNSAYRRGSDKQLQPLSSTIKPNEWILDSGASDHMSHKRDWFWEIRQDHTSKDRNGNTIPAIGCGNIRVHVLNGEIWQNKFLENVLYVPDLHINLFSTVCVLDKDFTLKANKHSYCYMEKQ